MIPSEVQIIEEVRAYNRALAINVKAIIDKRDEWEALYRELVTLCETQEEVIRDLRTKMSELLDDGIMSIQTGELHDGLTLQADER